MSTDEDTNYYDAAANEIEWETEADRRRRYYSRQNAFYVEYYDPLNYVKELRVEEPTPVSHIPNRRVHRRPRYRLCYPLYLIACWKKWIAVMMIIGVRFISKCLQLEKRAKDSIDKSQTGYIWFVTICPECLADGRDWISWLALIFRKVTHWAIPIMIALFCILILVRYPQRHHSYVRS
ncbi:uncharacterized protein BYT42DRAFT_564498 [Radiomyces spectabilis]|uniref:uncharacterized protein n=1 Tax=Radiomyces spectabilis TaxID=64574 RepID=UPI00221ED54A|nr:uncharacterized protein BYT42DRAFT_564498 [Radiomyces spectabilis]KAI8385047.1 hypothetical protein BYT42DRAFT_564498 [Radiomyces spectabilis]